MEDIKSVKVKISSDDIAASAFFNLVDPALVLNESGRIVEVNQAYVFIFKAIKGDLIEHYFVDVIPASEPEKEHLRQSLRSLNPSQASLSVDTFILNGEGTRIRVIIKIQQFTHNKSIYNICSITDISTLLRKENEIKSSDEKNGSRFDNANVLIQSVSQEGGIVYANNKWLETLGYTKNELPGLNIADIIREDMVPHCFLMLNKVKQGERLEYVETVFITKDGREIFVEGNIDGQFDNGNFTASRGIFRDITKRKMVEESYRLLIKNLPIPVYVAQKGIFKFVNPAFKNLTEFSEDELLVSHTADLVHPEDRSRVYKLATRSLKANNPTGYEFKVIKKSGEARWVMETVISIPYEGGKATLGAMIDITEQKLFEKALDDAKTRFQTIFNSASDAIYIRDGNDHILEVNDAACKLLGYTRSELLKLSMDMIISPNYKIAWQKERIELAEKGEVRAESENISKDGRIIPVEVNSRKIEYEKRLAYLAVIRDITERKQVESIRQRNESRLESLVRIAQMNPDNRQELLDLAISELVKLTESQFGYIYLHGEGTQAMTLNTWVGDLTSEGTLKDGLLVCPIEEIGNLEQNLEAYKPRIVNTRQLPHIKQNGYPTGAYEIDRHIIFPVFRKGLMTAIVSVANKKTDYGQADINQFIIILDMVWNLLERQEAESALKKSESKFRLLVENQSDLVIETDASGMLTFVNPAYCKFTGLTERELLGVSGMSKVHPDDRESLSKFMQSLREPPYTGYNEHRTLASSGWRWVAWVFNSVLDNNGNLKATTSIGRDITESKQAKEELEKANQRLRELDKLKDNFLSTVSHEMRTPLASIKSFAEILLTYEEDKPTQREFLQIINDESDRLTRLINDFLDLSKIQAGHMKWKKEPVSLDDAIRTAVTSAKTLMDKNRLSFTLNIESKLPLVLSDRDRMIQVITNLLSNATKFTPEGGSVTLEARLDKKGTSNEAVIVSVQDTGIGIAPEYHKSIFENFGQVGDILKDRPRGTGLGLPICKKIIENYGGNIWLKSVIGKGTTFYFSLPTAKPDNNILKA